MSKLLAVAFDPFEGIGPLGKLAGNTGASVFCQFENMISLILGVLTVSAGLWFIFQFFAGALAWLASGGEKQALQNAQKRITTAIVGLLVVTASYALIGLISAIFGLKILTPFSALYGTPSSGCTPLINTGGSGGTGGPSTPGGGGNTGPGGPVFE